MGGEREEVVESAGDEEVVETNGDDDRAETRETLSRVHEWVFLTGNRWLVASGVLALFLVVLYGIEFNISTGSQEMTPLFYVTSAVIGGNFTLLTIVISINQLVISRQLGDPGELAERIENTTAYRDVTAESVEETVLPPTPGAFLEALLRGVRSSVEDLQSHGSEMADGDAAAVVDEVLESLDDQIGRSIGQLEKENVTVFEALVVSLNTNYSDDIYRIRRLQTAYREELAPDAEDRLDAFVTSLKRIDVARQYLKTVYIQGELSRLSRNLMYIGVPAILAGLGLMEVFASTQQPVLSPGQISVITPVFVTFSGAPLALLFAYVLRLSVVSERTAAITPFTTPTQEATPVEAITDDAED